MDEKFSFDLILRSSYPIDALRLPGHSNVQIQQISDKEWRLSLVNQMNTNDESGGTALSTVKSIAVVSLNQDLLVYWRHAEGLPGSLDMLAYRMGSQTGASGAKAKGTFMLTLTPGDDLAPLADGRDWVFILDTSGSMQGKFATLAEGVRQGLGKLSPLDRFRVVMFNSHASDFSGGYLPATPESIQAVSNRFEGFQPQGSTNLYAGLKMGLSQLDRDRSSAIILVTDGVANVGVTEKKAFIKLLEQRDVRLFTFIMGNSANCPLLQRMTEVSNGFAQTISNADDIVGQLLLATSKMTHQSLRDIDLKITGARVTDVTPARINSLYRGQQLTVFGHYWQGGEVEVQLSGKVAGENRAYKTRFNLPDSSTRNPELERLWAFAEIEHLQAEMDYLGVNADREQAITDVALEYALVTDYTSMIVVDDTLFQQLGIERNNQTRVLHEQAARAQRQQQPVQNNRVDRAQPMFAQPRSGIGSGAVDPWTVLLVCLLQLY